MANLTDREILSQMFRQKACIDIEVDMHNKTFVTLQETQSPDSKVKIRHIPADSLVLNIDDFMSLNDIFNGNHGECKRADYVIINEDKKCIIFIEMKRTKDTWKNIVKQLKGSKCFIDYCQNLGKTFWQQDGFLEGYQHRFVSFGGTNLPKKQTKITRTAKQGCKHDTPDTALKVESTQRIQFNRLASLE